MTKDEFFEYALEKLQEGWTAHEQKKLMNVKFFLGRVDKETGELLTPRCETQRYD